MKKILLFIFTFGITFSLYNISAFADSDIKRLYYQYDNNPEHFGVIFTRSTSPVYITYTNNNNGTFNITSNVPLTAGYNWDNYHTIAEWERLFENNQVYDNGGAPMNNLKAPLIGQNFTSISPNTPADFSTDVYDSLEDYLNPPEPPIDISKCAFFFESDPNTGFYYMYCFPQELEEGEVVTVYYDNLDNIAFDITSASVNTLKRCYIEIGINPDYSNSIEYWLTNIDNIKLEDENWIDFLYTTPIYALYCDFIENNDNPNYNIFPLTEESWWDDIVNDIGFENTTLGFIWDWLFGEPGPIPGHEIIVDPNPSPTPLPTPIPYEVVIKPDGNGGYKFEYQYENENGNQITASAPPNQPIYDGNDLQGQSQNINISGVPVSDVEGVQSLINVLGEADRDYSQGFNAIGKSFATLPKKWFMFFGIPAAIILIAGIIKSLLG